jgi:hypothetical protein
MANKSSLPPNQDQKKFIQDENKGKENVADKAAGKKERSQQNKGYSEDQPGHPVRTTGSMRPDQESDLSTRKEPGQR